MAKNIEIEPYTIREPRKAWHCNILNIRYYKWNCRVWSETVEYAPIKVQGVLPNNIPNIFPNNIRSKYPQIAEVVWHVASLLNNTPGASADQIGKAIGISGRMVRNHIATLRNHGFIERIGSNKSGYWKVNRIEGGELWK